jgi:hypothetical protein
MHEYKTVKSHRVALERLTGSKSKKSMALKGRTAIRLASSSGQLQDLLRWGCLLLDGWLRECQVRQTGFLPCSLSPLFSTWFFSLYLMSQCFWDVEISGRVRCGSVRVCRTSSHPFTIFRNRGSEKSEQVTLVCCTSFNVSQSLWIIENEML